MDHVETIRTLEHNVSEVTKQLYDSYKRIAELTQERDNLMHHQLSSSEITSKEKKY